MSRRFVTGLVMTMALCACSHSPRRSQNRAQNSVQDSAPSGELGVYHDSAFDDLNRAPSSMTPPADIAMSEDRVDAYSNRTKADYYYSVGEAQSFEGQHQKAIEAFKTVLIYDANAAPVMLRLAAEYVKMGLMTEALESAQQAVKQDPKMIEALILLGGLHSTLRDYDAAISEYQKVLELDSDNTEAPMYLGAVFAEKKEYAKAIAQFESLTKNPDYNSPYLAWYYMGRIYADQEPKPNWKAAEKAYRKALQSRPEHIDSALALGQALSKQGHPDQAIEFYKVFQREQGGSDKIAEILVQVFLEKNDFPNALEQLRILEKSSDDSLSVKVRIALLLVEMKKYPLAAEKLQEVLRQVPDSDKIRFYLAAVFEEMSEPEKAVENFMKVPAGSSFYSESVIHASYLLRTLKRSPEALAMAETALREKPEVPQLYSVLANLYDEKGQTESAEKTLLKGLEKFPDNIQLNFFMGTIYDRKGNKEKLIGQMRKVINMDPQNVQGLNYLAFTFAEMGENLDEAEDLAQKAFELDPKDGFVLDTYGWVLFKRGHTREAIPYLEKAHAAQPNESVIAEHLGDAYYRSQLFDKARSMYERAIDRAENPTKTFEIQQKLASFDSQARAKSEVRQPASVSESLGVSTPLQNSNPEK